MENYFSLTGFKMNKILKGEGEEEENRGPEEEEEEEEEARKLPS
jgi:hypothetical protein